MATLAEAAAAYGISKDKLRHDFREAMLAALEDIDNAFDAFDVALAESVLAGSDVNASNAKDTLTNLAETLHVTANAALTDWDAAANEVLGAL
jgi:hypothetical protein